MSWNKNTINTSEVNAALVILKDTNTPYTLEVLGSVNGDGLNDDFGTGSYECRKLTYGGKVLMEHMIRTFDCDSDDCFTSVRFDKGKEPATKDWRLSYYQHDPDFCDGSVSGCDCRK